MKSNHFSHNYKSIKTCIETEISTTSFYNSIDLRFKLDTGRSNNYILFHLYKKLFPKFNNMYIRQPKTCRIKLRHNEKEKIYKFFVAHYGSMAVLGMQDIDRLGMLSINLNSKNRQVAEDNKDNCESQRQIKSDKWEQLKDKEQETQTTYTQDANNNPTVMVTTIKSQLLPFQNC